MMRRSVAFSPGIWYNCGMGKNLLLLCALCACAVSFAADRSKLVPAVRLTEPRAYTNAAGKVLLYRWSEPKSLDPEKKFPLVILFHGAGERGSDNKAQLVHGATDLLNYMRQNGIEAYFIAGQCPGGQQWVNTPWNLPSHTMPAEPSEAMGLAMELIEQTMKTCAVDQSRVLVTGISMGGYATWDIVQRRPEWFAAAMPCCGGGDVALAEKIRGVSIWAFHGDKDTVVPTKRSRDMTSALWAVDGKIRYREYPGVGHCCWGPTYADWDVVLKWFFSQRK